MKTLITTLNSKFIHTSLSLRLLYVACYHQFDIDFKEYTIKDSLEHIVDDLLSMKLDVLAFSCYIWNIEYIKSLCSMLKQRQPELCIILGGPEVTYEPAYFLENYAIDYVISGEGEKAFPMLLEAIEKDLDKNIRGVNYLGHVTNEVAMVDLSYVESLDSPYHLKQDQANMAKRILYFETSRGCPFQCQYCLSSLEKGLRFFSEDYLKKQLDIICHSGAKTIKLLDRSFNADAKHAIMILDYIFQNYQEGQQFQFEINADVLDQRIIDFIKEKAPKNLLRFEIGIQSTYEPTNRAVKRIQNFERLSDVVQQLMKDGKCDLHLDLIAGLPYEDYNRFAQSFDEVFAFRAKELQLGFLKLLRGTSLRHDAQDYGYVYQAEPPYEMIENHWMKKADIEKIHMAEDMLEKYWNSGRFVRTMNKVMDQQTSPFDFFYQFACFYQDHHYKKIGYQLDELFIYLDQYLSDDYHELLIQDYLSLFKVKPKRWYQPTLSATSRKEVIRTLAEKYQLDQELLFRYAIVEKLQEGYLVVIYKDYQCKMDIYK
ncbi:B12-binding domain-containing radical SAM protein [Longibaculum muris]|uniref:B12-binding domain-containing radical SAM protein n=1 Tax=Longibaculum muris TaxID=1796628 RepID=UPI0022E94DBA|nr:B12-binding domain-containing radical SAM protein [Longibaculum muris]